MAADADDAAPPRPDPSAAAAVTQQVALEQERVDRMYARLDELRRTVDERLQRVRRAGPSGTPQNRSERDAFAGEYERRLAQLWSVEERLAFGRLDLTDRTTRYIGRLGLSDEDQHQLLVDWRADAAQDFYRATGASPGDVVRRRHLAMRGRAVIGVEDEAFDLDRATGSDEDALVLSGEGALMAALAEHRTGRMRDIVSTIQGEQDRIIRSPLEGVLVVQGGPGTGKTAVALHRAAYLLYQHRERLARTGVLVVGPNPLFLRYIEQVLPSLGESAVVLMTTDELYAGVDPVPEPDPRLAALKGDARMATVVRRAVRGLQRVPDGVRTLDVDGVRIELRPRDVERARDRARRSGRPHNAARESFVRQVLDILVDRLAQAVGVEPDRDHRDGLLASLRDARDVRREVNLCWLPTTPTRLVARLLTDAQVLQRAADGVLSKADQQLLLRAADAPWTSADVPLLDEADHLLGDDGEARRAEERRAAAERAADLEYASQVLASTGAGGGLVDAATLAARFATGGADLTVAERAVEDRGWTYGHVVVDEAQEVSAMAWRALVRRCPSRSMTVVGDTAQTSSSAGADDWAEVLDRFAPGRWRLEELTVNYRTPAEVMALADRLLRLEGQSTRRQVAARHGDAPVVVAVEDLDLDALEHVVAPELEALGAGRLAVVFPREGYGELANRLHEQVTGRPRPPRAVMLDESLVTLDVGEVKGLEFDVVVVVEPSAVLEQSAHGIGDLYVAMTRPTQRLVVVHSGTLPSSLSGAPAEWTVTT